MEKSRKAIRVIAMMLLLFMGLALGTSIMSFILSLTRSDKLLSILSYFCLLLFILFMMLEIVIYVRYIDYFRRTKKGQKLDE